MRFVKLYGIPLLLVGLCGFLLRSAYLEVKEEAVRQLNQQQLVMAKESARSIEEYFTHYGRLLKHLAGLSEIVSLDAEGRRLMQRIYETHATDIQALTRLDAQGNVLCTFPENPQVTSLIRHEHVQKIVQTHQPVVSDAFTALMGSASVAYHVPVFDGQVFVGSLGVLIPFSDITRRYLDAIKIGEDGYPWVITQKGVEIYCPVPGHVGRTVFENCKDFPSILAMAEEMLKGKEGTATYTYDRIRGQTVESITKHAVYVPIYLDNTFWSIVVATPEDEVLGFIQGFRDRWLMIVGLLLVVAVVWAYFALRTMVLWREEKRRRQTEEALISANQQLNDIIEFLPDATFVIDRDKKVIAWNRAIEEMTGVSKEAMIGQGDYAVTVPFYGERRPHLLDLFETPDPELESKYQHIAKKGNILYAETFVPALYEGRGAYVFATGARLFDAHGQRVGAIESIRDITERKLAEEALRESEQRLADIINFLPDATFVIDGEGRVIAWNRAIEEMTGTKALDMLGKGGYEYAVPFYGERRPILIDLVLHPQNELEKQYTNTERRGSVLCGETHIPGLRGGKAYLLGTASALHDSKGNVVGAIESIHDITERRQAEEALAQAEEKYRGIFENAALGIFQTSLEGRVLSANPAYARILGYSSPEETMDEITDLSAQVYVHPEERRGLLQILEERGAVEDYEIQVFRKDRSIAWVSMNIRFVRDTEGKVQYLEGSVQDITDRKALESRLFQAQKMEAIGTLAGGIAHDFNNILAAIIGYTEMTKSRLRQEELHGYLERVLEAGDRAKHLVAQILAFSRTGANEARPVDIGPLIDEGLKLLRATLPSTIEFRQHIAPNLSAVLADPTQIHQVLINLCTNAAHAMRARGGVLAVALENVAVTSTTASLEADLPIGRYVRLTVTDTGTGIAAETLHRIFDPFFTTKKQGEGTGLGLSVVYGIVKGCGGAVTVNSELGAGSVFTVYLPAIDEHAEMKPEFLSSVPRGSENILLIDDEEMLIEMGRDALEDLGYRVTAVSDSGKALEIFRSRPSQFDLVITDMTMPGMTGADLSREFLKIRPDVPIILCTGYSELITEEEARALGIQGFALKPVSLAVLANLIAQILSGRSTPS